MSDHSDFGRRGASRHDGHGRNPRQVATRCPVCEAEMRITRLACDACGSALEGSFTLGRFQRLTREQWQFVELFMLCRGKIKDVEERLGVSYPTVVARLNEVVRALGYEVDQRESDALAAGRLTPAEAAEQLRGLGAR